MQLIVRNEDDIAIYLFEDDIALTVLEEEILVGSPPHLIISDCNAKNVTVHDVIDAPADWVGWKYIYSGSKWKLNPDYIEPGA